MLTKKSNKMTNVIIKSSALVVALTLTQLLKAGCLRTTNAQACGGGSGTGTAPCGFSPSLFPPFITWNYIPCNFTETSGLMPSVFPAQGVGGARAKSWKADCTYTVVFQACCNGTTPDPVTFTPNSVAYGIYGACGG